jgi:hypothetical protein
MLQDIWLAIRTWRAMPVVSAIAIVSLALGIGANTALFSLVDGLLLRPLPLPNPDQFAVLTGVRRITPFGAIDLHKQESQIRIVIDSGDVLDRRLATTRDRLTAMFGTSRFILSTRELSHASPGRLVWLQLG